MSDRKATYESRDTKFEKSESARKAKYQKQIDHLNARNQSAGPLSIEELEMIDSEKERMNCDTSQNQVLFTPPLLQERSHKRTKKTGTTLTLSRNFLSDPALV